MMTKTVLLYSSGMDSFICNYLYKPDILLYIRVGSKYEEKELRIINEFLNDFKLHHKFKMVNLSFLKDYELDNAHIPLRNLLFLEIASFYGDTVMMGALRGETSKDKTKKFRFLTEQLLSYCWDDKLGLGTKKKIKILFPLKNMTKTKALKLFIKKGGCIADLKQYTVSCYSPQFDACGNCMSCFRRWVAEINNDIFIGNIALGYDLYGKKDSFYKKIMNEQYKGFWNKFKQIFTKEFWMNIPSNIGAIKAIMKFKKEFGFDMANEYADMELDIF